MRSFSALLLSVLLSHSGISFATPLEFDAHYTAKAMGLSATAHRSSTQTDTNTYLLQNSLELTVMSFSVGSMRETSEFTLREGQLLPLNYEYTQTGVSSTNESISFDWDTGRATSVVEDETFQIPLEASVLDKLNFSFQLGEDIAQNSQTQATEKQTLNEFRYRIVDGDRTEEHVYKITANETLNTAIGSLNTVKLERVRESASKRKTTIWLAQDWQHLLVKLEQVSSSGTVTEIVLESATIDGKAIQ